MAKKIVLLLMVFMLNLGVIVPSGAFAVGESSSTGNGRHSSEKPSAKERSKSERTQNYSANSSGTLVWVESSKKFVKAGDTFSVYVGVQNVYDLFGASLDMKFNPNEVTALNVTPGEIFGELTSVDSLPDDSTTFDRGYFYSKTDNETGELTFLSFLTGNEPSINDGGLFVKIDFQANAAISTGQFLATLTDSRTAFDSGEYNTLIQLSDSNAASIYYDGNAEYSEVNITDAIIAGTVYEETTSNFNIAKDVSVNLYNSSSEFVDTTSADDNGNFYFSNPSITAGTYYIEVIGQNYEPYFFDLELTDTSTVHEEHIYLTPKGLYTINLTWGSSTVTEDLELDLRVKVLDRSTGAFIDEISWNNSGATYLSPYLTHLQDTHGPSGHEIVAVHSPTDYLYEVTAVNYYGEFSAVEDANVKVTVNDYNGVILEEYTYDGAAQGSTWSAVQFTFDSLGDIQLPDGEGPQPQDAALSTNSINGDTIAFDIYGQGFSTAQDVEVWLYRDYSSYNQYSSSSSEDQEVIELVKEEDGVTSTVPMKNPSLRTSSGYDDQGRYAATIGEITDTSISVTGVEGAKHGDYFVEVYLDGQHLTLQNDHLRYRPAGIYVEELINAGNYPYVLPLNYDSYDTDYYPAEFHVYNLPTASPTFEVAFVNAATGTDEIVVDGVTSGIGDPGQSYFTFNFPTDLSKGTYEPEIRVLSGAETLATIPLPLVMVGEPFIEWVDLYKFPLGETEFSFYLGAKNLSGSDTVSLELYQRGSTTPTFTAVGNVVYSDSYLTQIRYNFSSFPTGLPEGDYELVMNVNGEKSLPYKLKGTYSPILQHVTPPAYKANVTSFYAWVKGYNMNSTDFNAELVNFSNEIIATSQESAIVDGNYGNEKLLQFKMTADSPILSGGYFLRIYDSAGEGVTELYMNVTETLNVFGYPYSLSYPASIENSFYLNGVNLDQGNWELTLTDASTGSVVPDVVPVTNVTVDDFGHEKLNIIIPALLEGQYYLVISNTALSNPITITLNVGAATGPFVHSVHIDGPDEVLKPLADSASHEFIGSVLDQYGHEMTNEDVTWSIEETVEGISIDSVTGTLTVQNTAAANSIVTIKATSITHPMIYATKTVTIKEQVTSPIVNSIVVDGPISITVPQLSNAVQYNATVYDQDGNVMSGEQVEWSLAYPVQGVSVNNTSGLVTVLNTASIGSFELMATSITDSSKSGNLVISLVSGMPTDTTPPAVPTVNPVDSDDTVVTGTAEPGSAVKITVNGYEIGYDITDGTGVYSAAIAAQATGTELTITATDAAGNESEPATIIVTESTTNPVDDTPPAVPTVNAVDSDDTVVTGTAEPNAAIKISIMGYEIGYDFADVTGAFSVAINPQAAGTELIITATDAAGNESESAFVTVSEAIVNPPEDTTPPAVPVINPVDSDDTVVTGTSEPESTLVVTVNSLVIGFTFADETGAYSAAIMPQAAGTEITVTAKDATGNESEPAKITVTEANPPVDTTPPAAPTVNPVDSDDTVVTGMAEAESTIKVTVSGSVIATGTANEYGAFSVAITPQNADTVLEVTATDAAENESEPVFITVKIAEIETGNNGEFANGKIIVDGRNVSGKVKLDITYNELPANVSGIQIDIPVPQNAGLSNPDIILNEAIGLTEDDIQINQVSNNVYTLLVGGSELVANPLPTSGKIGTITFDTASTENIDLRFNKLIFTLKSLETPQIAVSNVSMVVKSLIPIPENHYVYDVNRDGNIDITDGSMILYWLTNEMDIQNQIPSITVIDRSIDYGELDELRYFYDVNLDGDINVTDYTTVLFWLTNEMDIQTQRPHFDGIPNVN
ncbi:Ig-like domain-containing protein [Bacillus sp. Marseille-P3661]|uniref:Ig-like domain-containing protein n=1 Tax=Bacillus sp. Marseille-P3661 TaxID=1936234 RepID=UPI000C84C60F|nr:Ig-like domain-containing protein [Bacillus sp. Marseille-P3661]